jgi:hypothetical protein
MNKEQTMTTITVNKVSVHAPATPGATHAVVGEFATMAEARAFCVRFSRDRRDMGYHDVVIRSGRDGKRIEMAGPCR